MASARLRATRTLLSLWPTSSPTGFRYRAPQWDGRSRYRRSLQTETCRSQQRTGAPRRRVWCRPSLHPDAAWPEDRGLSGFRTCQVSRGSWSPLWIETKPLFVSHLVRRAACRRAGPRAAKRPVQRGLWTATCQSRGQKNKVAFPEPEQQPESRRLSSGRGATKGDVFIGGAEVPIRR
jgi:hypothetical protein